MYTFKLTLAHLCGHTRHTITTRSKSIIIPECCRIRVMLGEFYRNMLVFSAILAWDVRYESFRSDGPGKDDKRRRMRTKRRRIGRNIEPDNINGKKRSNIYTLISILSLTINYPPNNARLRGKWNSVVRLSLEQNEAMATFTFTMDACTCAWVPYAYTLRN